MTINSDSTDQKYIKFAFIVTCSIFLQSYWISDDVILIFSNLVYYLQSVLSSRLKLVNFNAIQWLSVSLGVIVHVQVTSLTYEAKSERNWRFLGSLPCVIQRIYHNPQKWSFGSSTCALAGFSQTERWVVKVIFLSLRPQAWTFWKLNFVNPLRFTYHQKKLRKLFTF